MPPAPPPRWSAKGWEPALAAAERLAATLVSTRPGEAASRLPVRWRLVSDRPMRVVVAGPLAGPSGPVDVHLKARRRTAGRLRARDRLRGPRGPAEGALLLALSERGVLVARPVAWSADLPAGRDLLVTQSVEDARSVSDATSPSRSRRERVLDAEAVGRLLKAAHDAGWFERDVHRGNVLLAPEGAVLLDPGTGRLGPPLSPARRVGALGIAAHGLGADARTGLLALRAYFGGDRATARRRLPLVARAAREAARVYRRGRSRRATRTGLHFEVFHPARGPATGVRSTDSTPASWKDLAASWIDAVPAGFRPLKDEGNVLAGRFPGLDREVVLKRWPALWRDRFRVPRSIRAFRRAYALRVRGVACPEPLLAASDGNGSGICVSGFAGGDEARAVDLARATRPESGGADPASPFASLPPARRREALHRLGRFLRKMHDAEVSHRDLKAPNLVAIEGATGVAFAVVDVDGARVHRRPVPWPRRAKDLARLDASVGSPPVTRADRLRVLRGYFAAFERLPVDRKTFARRVREWSAAKRGPTGAPR